MLDVMPMPKLKEEEVCFAKMERNFGEESPGIMKMYEN